jgi:hypothetical protein
VERSQPEGTAAVGTDTAKRKPWWAEANVIEEKNPSPGHPAALARSFTLSQI